MDRFVPREKMSKKEKKKLDARKRQTWDARPVTRIVPNKKKEMENRKPRPGHEDAGWGDFPIYGRKMNNMTA